MKKTILSILFFWIFIFAAHSKSVFPSENKHIDTSKTIKNDIQAAEYGLDENLLVVDKITLLRDSMAAFARTFLGKPYIYGGTTPRGFDCSGFVQYVFQQFGYAIPRVSGAQVALGKTVKPEEAKAGDLVFYGYRYGQGYVYTHTAMVYANDKKGLRVIHSILLGLCITGLHFDPNRTPFVCIKSVIE